MALTAVSTSSTAVLLPVVLFLFGLITGSFLNVCIHRIPRGESVVYPPSHCPACQSRLRPADLVPVLSYLFLRGRCRYCGCRISRTYPVVEIVTGILWVLLLRAYGPTPQLAYAMVVAGVLVVIAFIDLAHYLIPNKLIIWGFALTASANLLTGSVPWVPALLGFAAGGAAFLAISLVSRGGMGGGDVKLAAFIGFATGWPLAVSALFVGSILAGVVGIFLILLKKKSGKDAIPFGPFLVLGAIIIFLWGGPLIGWYLGLFGM